MAELELDQAAAPSPAARRRPKLTIGGPPKRTTDAVPARLSGMRRTSNLSEPSTDGSPLGASFARGSTDAPTPAPASMYQHFGVLGKGQSSTVRLARHAASGELVAIKTLNATPGSDGSDQALRELAILNEHDSPSLTRIIDSFYADARIHLVLEWMAAGSLDGLLRERGVPAEALAAVLAQMLCGLGYLHRRRHQIHRDVKPGNVLVDVSGAVKLCDFGIATEVLGSVSGSRGGGSLSSKQAHSFVGTGAYMAPERIRGGYTTH